MILKSLIAIISLISFFGYAVVGPTLSILEDNPMCDTEAVEGCLDKLKTFLNITNLPFTSDEKELDLLCEKASSGYNCSKLLYTNYTDCLRPEVKDNLDIFISMAEYMYRELCEDGHNNFGYLTKAFLDSSDCLMRYTENINCCAQKANITDIPYEPFMKRSEVTAQKRYTLLCCPVSRYLQCISSVAKDFCGQVASNLFSQYVWQAAGKGTESACGDLLNYPLLNTTMCPGPVNECSGSSVIQSNLFNSTTRPNNVNIRIRIESSSGSANIQQWNKILVNIVVIFIVLMSKTGDL